MPHQASPSGHCLWKVLEKLWEKLQQKVLEKLLGKVLEGLSVHDLGKTT